MENTGIDYTETYEDMRDIADDVLTLLKKLKKTAGKRAIIIEIDIKNMELSVYEDDV